ncbi:cation:proton antiporter [Desulfovibrio oxyclinae]|jgi:CPA2 family monovalent cation:H+ antiporter-2|uniref:cation:proton antiporter domain-containing protein n=1 Tax=Desulfovibrio oxyclinae TaxID=63560 RepID=UPI00037FBFDF|nr:cation:proton antiporter [Desulfovibrio oxyclinae]
MGIAADLIIIILASLICAFAAKKLRQPLIIGYIIAGLIVGPNTGGITVGNAHEIELLAEIGVALLLFVLGIEFSLSELKPVRLVSLVGGPIQIILTAIFGFGVGKLFGLSTNACMWLGAFFSLSSTMVALKTMENQRVLGTLSSKVMIGMLIVQDFALVPLIIILPEIGDLGAGLSRLGWAVIKSAAFLTVMIFLGRTAIPWLMHRIARWNSREMFLLSTCAIGLGIGYATHLAGLSFALGAFMAGLLLSESDYAHQVMSNILPLRDIFGLLFFASAGMLLDPAVILSNPGKIALITLLLFLGKGLIFFGVTRAFGYRNIVPLATALTMWQVGELSFLLARAGLSGGALSQADFALFMASAVVSMILTPLASRLAAPLYSLRKRFTSAPPYESINIQKARLNGHVAIIGGGTIGRAAAEILRRFGKPYLVAENNFRRVERLKKDGHPVIYGDATIDVVLEAMHLDRASVVLITTPAHMVSRTQAQMVRRMAPDVALIARAEDASNLRDLSSMGVNVVVQPSFEAGLEFVRQTLSRLDVPTSEINNFTERVHRDLYEPLREDCTSEDFGRIVRHGGSILELFWVDIPIDSPLVGKTIEEAEIRKRTGASVVAIMRIEGLVTNPDPDEKLLTGDMIAIIGRQAEFRKFGELYGTEKAKP